MMSNDDACVSCKECGRARSQMRVDDELSTVRSMMYLPAF